MNDASRLTGGTPVSESLSAWSTLSGTPAPAPSDAFERGFSQRRLHRDTDTPTSQSRPWLLWFLVISLSSGIAATVIWSDMSISSDGAPRAVGSDSAWRGVIRQPRPDRSALVPKLAKAANNAPPAPATAPKKPRTKIAAYSGTSVKAPGTPPLRAEPSALGPSDRPGDPTVLSIQGLLSKIGFRPGPVDGLMGKRTQTAILAWQLQEGLPTTGRPSKLVLEQLLDPAKVSGEADRLPIGVLARTERDTLEAWCTTGRNAANYFANNIAYYECMGDEIGKLKSGLRLPESGREASGNFDAFATARLLCTDQTDAAPQAYFKCLHAKLGKDRPLLVME